MGLFSPIWMTDKYEKEKKAIAAVQKIQDQDQLYEIAVTAPREEVRIAAAERINDDRKLLPIVLLEGMPEEIKLKYNLIPEKVTKFIQDENILAEIVLNSEYPGACRVATEKITDQRLLARIVREGRYSAADKAARKLEDPSIIKETLLSYGPEVTETRDNVGILASKLADSDPNAVPEILLKTSSPGVRYALVSMLKGHTDLLLDLASRETKAKYLEILFRQVREAMKQEPPNDAQRSKYVDAVIRISDPAFSLYAIDYSLLKERAEDLLRVFREGQRNDIRAYVFSDLVQKKLLPIEELPGAYQWVYEANDQRHNLGPSGDNTLQMAKKAIPNYLQYQESENIPLLTDLARRADVHPDLRILCVKLLFDEKLNGVEGIDVKREEVVQACLKDFSDDTDSSIQSICALAIALPVKARGQYGFTAISSVYDGNEMNQYSRFTVHFRDKTYKQDTTFGPFYRVK